jgi:peptide/nickel transport system substrate-binding protein
VLFWWSIALDERYAMQPPEWAYASGGRMDVRAPDPYTLVFEYPEPYVLLPQIMATGFWTSETVVLPSHYLRDFHPDTSGYPNFNELDRRNNPANNPARPTLAPWRLVEYARTGERAAWERNPYYWGVDPEGRQLPYLDRIEATRVQSPESGVLLAIGGSVDLQFRFVDLRDYALLKRSAHRGGYRIETWEEGTAAWHAVFFNLEHPDPARRALLSDPNFRRGLSLALNRERINQVVFNGVARPQQAAISDESWHFHSPRGEAVRERWTTAWAELDRARANALLDAAGLHERDARGFRTYRGQPFTFELDHFPIPYAADQAPLIASDWEAVGVRTRVRRATDVALWTRVTQGDYDAYMQHNSELDVMTFPDYVFPVVAKSWHPLTGRWVATGGAEGEAPSGIMRELVDLYDRVTREPDLDARHDLVLDAIELQIEHGPFMLGTAGRQKALVVAKHYVRNLPETGVMGPWAAPQPATSFPEQLYYDADHLYGAGGTAPAGENPPPVATARPSQAP